MWCAGLSLVGALARAQEESSDSLHELDARLARENVEAGELGPTGQRLYADELMAAIGARGRFGFGLAPLGWRAPLLLEILDENGSEIELQRVGGTRYPSHATERWSGGGLELAERKYITFDDSLIVELELRETSGESHRELLFRLRGDATPWRERARSKHAAVSLGAVGEQFHHELATLSLASGRLEHDGVVFPLASTGEASSVRGVGPSARGESARLPLPDPRPVLATLHLLLAVGEDPSPALVLPLDDGSLEVVSWPEPDRSRAVADRVEWQRVRVPGTEAELWHLAWDPPPARFAIGVELSGASGIGPLLLSAVVEKPPREGRLPVLLGEIPTTAGSAHVCLAGTDFAAGVGTTGARVLERYESIPAGETIAFRAALVIGPRILPVLAGALDATVDEKRFGAHVAEYHRWFAEQTPRFACDDPRLEYVWNHAWYRLRRRMLMLGELGYSLPILRDEAASHVSCGSLGRILPDLRWLTDLAYAQGQVRAFMMRQNEEGELADRLPVPVGWGPPRYLSTSIVDVFAVHGDELFLRENLPLLEASAKARASVPAEDPDSEWDVLFSLMEFPGLVRGRRALGEESAATELEERYRTEVGFDESWTEERIAGFFRGTTFLWPDAEAVEQTIGDSARRYASWLGLKVGTPGARAMIDPWVVAGPDQLIRFVGGLRPRDDGRLELRPRIFDLEHFAFERVHHRGRVLDLYWDRPDGEQIAESIPEGYTLFVDGEQRFHAAELTDVVLD